MESTRFHIDSGPSIVRLSFTSTILSDNGIWRCDIYVESEQDFVRDGKLIRSNTTIISAPIQHSIHLTVIGKFEEC